MRTRRGAILILTIGVCAMLAALALGFIARTRIDALEMSQVMRQAQARVMLSAACAYVLETARIGWDDPTDNGTPGNIQEAFGWVDVRSGLIGPRDPSGNALYSNTKVLKRRLTDSAASIPSWPAIGAVCLAPMMVYERPSFAIDRNVTPNPIVNDPNATDFGLPLLKNEEPRAQFSPDLAASATVAQRWTDWKTGNRIIPGDPSSPLRLRTSGDQQAWFRLRRDGPATFVVTAGCGGTLGFRDWDEVEVRGATARFANDQAFFDQLLEDEIRMWYRIEWSPAIRSTGAGYDAVNGISSSIGMQRWATMINQAGTISFIQRLRSPPVEW